MDQIKCELQDSFGNDRFIAEAAWTSSLDYQKKESRTDEDVARVVKMLATAKHSTPFESVIFRFWMRIPIAIDRQLMTHRLQSASGMSGRYRTMPDEFLEMPKDIEAILCQLPDKYESMRAFRSQYRLICEDANSWYQETIDELKEYKEDELIDNNQYKRLREFFRGVLPQHNMTERVTTMNLRSFANFIKLRNSEHAQPEIRYLAQLMLQEVKNKAQCPVAIEFLEKNNWEL